MLLGLRAQPREDTGLSPAEAVFGAPIVLPNEFLQNEEMPVDAIMKNFSKTLHVPAVSLPRHNSSAQLPDELPGDLLSAPLIWVRRGSVIPPLQPLYTALTPSCAAGPAPSPSESWDEVIAVIRLKACTAVDATPGSPRRHGRLPGSTPRRSRRNQGGLVFRPAGFFTFTYGTATRRSLNRFPTQQGGFCMPWTGDAFTGATDAVPILQRAPPKRLDL